MDAGNDHPRHKIIRQCESLESALSALEDVATQYIIKMHKPSFTQNNDDAETKIKVQYETKYTMCKNKHDPNIIEIHEKTTKIETKPGTLYGETQKVTRFSKQVGYFCYIKYNFVQPPQTCDNCLMTINRPVPQRVVPQSGMNLALLQELHNNGKFQILQRNVDKNRLDLSSDDPDSTDVIDSEE